MSVENDDYSLVVLSKIPSNTPLPTDIYLYLDNKYVKYLNRGDVITPEKFDLFISKGLKNIYVLSDEIMDFLAWINEGESEAEEQLVKQVGEDNRKYFHRDSSFKEKIYDVFFEEELDKEKVETLKEYVTDFIEEVKQSPITAKAISALMKKNSSIADHSLSVANLAIYIGMALGHGHQFVLENLYMGGIFHDYGKAKIAPEVLENINNNLYSQAINDHPLEGVRIAQKGEGIPGPVLKIIAQHHEQYNGHGYPKGLSGDQIYDLAQIVSMANVFDNTLKENDKIPEKERYKKAIKVIEYDKGKTWNPKYIERVLQALNLAFIG